MKIKTVGFLWIALAYPQAGYANLGQAMTTHDYARDKAISLNFVKYGASNVHLAKRPNSDFYIKHPERYVGAASFIEIWGEGLRTFCKQTLPRYQKLMSDLNVNDPDQANLLVRFRDDFGESSATAQCNTYGTHIDRMLSHRKDFDLPHYLDKYTSEYFEEAKSGRRLVATYADVTSSKFSFRVGLELALEAALTAYEAHGGDENKLHQWRAQYKHARDGLRGSAKQQWSEIAQGMRFPEDRYRLSDANELKRKIGNAYSQKFGVQPELVITRSSIFSEEFFRLTGLRSGVKYHRMPIYVVVPGKNSSELQFGFYQRLAEGAEDAVFIVYRQPLPPLGLGAEISKNNARAAAEAERLAAEEAALVKKQQLEDRDAQVADFEAKAQAEAAALLREAQQQQEHYKVESGDSHPQTQSESRSSDDLFGVQDEVSSNPSSALPLLLNASLMLFVGMFLSASSLQSHLPAEVGAKQFTLIAKIEENLSKFSVVIVFVGLIGAWLSFASDQTFAFLGCTLAAAVGLYLFCERALSVHLDGPDVTDNQSTDRVDDDQVAPSNPTSLRKIVGYVSLGIGLMLVISLIL